MDEGHFIAIDSDALHAKSKVYIGRALHRKGDDDLDEYQLWSSLAVELLGKAALARRHPSLIVDPTHWQSLFVAAGVNITTDVKTITAKTLFERLGHLVPRFDTDLQTFCKEIAERRNAELHSADLPFRTMRLEVWEAKYWHACETILHDMSSSLENWLGAEDAEAPRALIEEATAARKAAVSLRIGAAAARFSKVSRAERERRLGEADDAEPSSQGNLFRRSYDEIWTVRCPACGSRAFMAGEQTSEEINEDSYGYSMWETVKREFAGEECSCPTCALFLIGSEIEDAGLDALHGDEEERELSYEPEYGND